MDSSIFYCQYNFIYPDTPGVRLPLASKVTLREDKIYHPLTNKNFLTHSLQLDIDYKIMTDFGFLLAYKTTCYPDPSWEPQGYPYSDNYLKIFVNINF